jgi:hypothetical protein
MFRAKYLDGLAGLLERGLLDLPPQSVELATPDSRQEASLVKGMPTENAHTGARRI